MPALPKADFPDNIWDADSKMQDRDANNFQADPKAEDYQRIAAEIIATQTELRRVQRIVEAEDILVTTNTTLDATADLILAEASTFELTLTLPDAATADGAVKRVKKIDDTGYKIRVNAAGSDTIDGLDHKLIQFQWSCMILQATETGWYII